MDVGDEQIYRARLYGPSERVKVVGIEKRKQSIRAAVEFLDGTKAGRRENIPGSRLNGPWSTVQSFDELRANWQRLNGNGDGLDDIEESAVLMVLIALIPEDVAIYYDSPVRHGITVKDAAALEQLVKRPMANVLEHIEWFEHAGEFELSAAGTLLIAEYVTAANPVPLLEAVMAEEAESRQDCKRGRERDAYDGSGKQMTSPEGEFAWYRRRIRPKHQLVRAWCKHRSVTFVERLIAAEAEVQRLDALVATLVDLLRKHDVNAADAYEHEHDDGRIRPETVRPVVDRPLAPWELPVREVPVRRGRWW
jgi:hypothetical protein